MDSECFIRLNDILREMDAKRKSIDDLSEAKHWFEGDDETEIAGRREEFDDLIEEAEMTGMIRLFPGEGSRQQPIQHWDWTTKAHRKAQRLGITLVNPLGDNPLFVAPSNRITLPTRTIQHIDIQLLAQDVYGHCNRVYEEQTRYIIFHQGKPVACVLPLPDLEILKDLQVGGYLSNWIEWNQNIRERLLWPPATQMDEEMDDA